MRSFRLRDILNPDVSYLQLRTLIGALGVLLPALVWIIGWFHGEWFVQTLDAKTVRVDTISAHYYTSSRDVFVITLALVGTLMFFYRTERARDNYVAMITGVAALGIGVFPMRPLWTSTEACGALRDCSPTLLYGTYDWLRLPWYGPMGLHGLALTLFVAGGLYLVFISFPKTSVWTANASSASHAKLLADALQLKPKQRRNRAMERCGWTMVVSIALFATSMLLERVLPPLPFALYRFFTESTFVVAFSVAWLIKGQYIPFFPQWTALIRDSSDDAARRLPQAKPTDDTIDDTLDDATRDVNDARVDDSAPDETVRR
ncbi:hypothetical protein [Deinococcus yavapaiensis]|uniref:Uncharacterized protein n=1 Tax=Deinococcus yavapaiensis KR-236 TaxID=694435 RepID=A0A318S5D3_9DEIO|nr:hypothetical protein [Deinococcus yavapaiensis]PYE51023.1 hypothetical protein DES52_11690 [Deinococcus yavapaiensis KR-236]